MFRFLVCLVLLKYFGNGIHLEGILANRKKTVEVNNNKKLPNNKWQDKIYCDKDTMYKILFHI